LVGVIVEVTADGPAGAGVTVTLNVAVIATLLIVPSITAVPAVADVRVAVYLPLAVPTVIALRVPNEVASVTVSVLVIRLLPFASLACTVITVEVEPLAGIEDAAEDIVVFTGVAVPGVTAMDVVDDIGAAFKTPLIVTGVFVTVAVKFAEYVPSPLSTSALRVPVAVGTPDFR